jgi:hypothetical protein
MLGVLALLAVGATTAGAASAKQVGLFEAGTSTQVSSRQQLGTVASFDLEGGRAQCHVGVPGDLETLMFEKPPLKTTIFYDDGIVPAECSSEVSGETVQMNDAVPVKIEVTGLEKAIEVGSARLYEYQPGQLYCVYGDPYKTHLTSPPGEDRTEWTGTAVFKRIHVESDDACAETVSSVLTVDVGAQETWDGEALETKRVS